jgi:hypothetical protein
MLITTTTTQLITQKLTSSNERKESYFEVKSGPGKKSWVFLFEEINELKRYVQLKPEKTSSSKNRKTESLLSTEINLTTSSHESESSD